MGPTAEPAVGRSALRKAAWRLIPFLCLLYVLNILDRVNAGFARTTTLEEDIGVSAQTFDLLFGLFYIGYLVFEVPSNLILRRVGARVWIARIVIAWGLVSCATMFVRDAWGFAAIRLLLGVAEAGFFPGIVLYLTSWFPAPQRAAIMAWFMTGVAVSGLVGNALSGAIVFAMKDVAGLKDWQWLFLLEGVPAVLCGIATFWVLTDSPADAGWLTPDEREWLTRTMAEEEAAHPRHHADHWRALVDARVWLLIALYTTVATGSNASGAYLPKLIKEHYKGIVEWQLGLLSALPHAVTLAAMTLWAANSDRTGERRWHVGLAALAAAAGWALVASGDPYLVLAGLCLAQAGMISMLPTFWTLPPMFLTGAAAAGGIALINSIANLGGLVGPYILGKWGPFSMAAVLAAGLPLALLVRPEKGEDSGGGFTLRPVGAGGDGVRGG